MEQVAERAGIPCSLGTYAQILFVLGLESDLHQITKDDVLDRKLQDAGMLVGKRAPKKK